MKLDHASLKTWYPLITGSIVKDSSQDTIERAGQSRLNNFSRQTIPPINFFSKILRPFYIWVKTLTMEGSIVRKYRRLVVIQTRPLMALYISHTHRRTFCWRFSSVLQFKVETIFASYTCHR